MLAKPQTKPPDDFNNAALLLQKKRQSSMKTVNSSSMQSNNTSSAEDLLNDEKLREFGRRLSIIGKPPPDATGSEDGGQEVKSYLDDLRSHRNSPLEVRDRTD